MDGLNYSLVDQLKINALDSLQNISVFPNFWRPVKLLVIWMLQTLSLGLKITPVWFIYILCIYVENLEFVIWAKEKLEIMRNFDPVWDLRKFKILNLFLALLGF